MTSKMEVDYTRQSVQVGQKNMIYIYISEEVL